MLWGSALSDSGPPTWQRHAGQRATWQSCTNHSMTALHVDYAEDGTILRHGNVGQLCQACHFAQKSNLHTHETGHTLAAWQRRSTSAATGRLDQATRHVQLTRAHAHDSLTWPRASRVWHSLAHQHTHTYIHRWGGEYISTLHTTACLPKNVSVQPAPRITTTLLCCKSLRCRLLTLAARCAALTIPIWLHAASTRQAQAGRRPTSPARTAASRRAAPAPPWRVRTSGPSPSTAPLRHACSAERVRAWACHAGRAYRRTRGAASTGAA
jgi:hypothetical protein